MSIVLDRLRLRQTRAELNQLTRLQQQRKEQQPPWTWKDTVGIGLVIAFMLMSIVGFVLFIHYSFIAAHCI